MWTEIWFYFKTAGPSKCKIDGQESHLILRKAVAVFSSHCCLDVIQLCFNNCFLLVLKKREWAISLLAAAAEGCRAISWLSSDLFSNAQTFWLLGSTSQNQVLFTVQCYNQNVLPILVNFLFWNFTNISKTKPRTYRAKIYGVASQAEEVKSHHWKDETVFILCKLVQRGEM